MSNEVKIELSASETRLISGLRKGEAAIKTYGQKAMDVFRRTGDVINKVSDRYLTRFNSALGAAGIALAGRAVIDFDSKLARVAITADLSKKQMLDLKAQLFEVAAATNQSPTALLEGVNAIVERTGNFKFAVSSLKDMGIVASATGARMEDIGATASNLQEKMGITQDQVMTVFDVLNKQGKQGAFTLQNMASMFERLLSAANRFDVSGVAGMRQFGAFLQIARRGTGSSEEATTAVENTFMNIMGKAKDLQAAGIQIIDPVKSKKAGRQVFRDFDLVIKDIIVKSKGNMLVLQEIFEARSIRAITPLVQSWKKFGDFREMDEFAKMGGDGATIMRDFAFWSEQTAAKIGNFKTQLSKFSNENLAGPIEMLNKALTVLNNHPALTKGALYTLMGFAAVMAGAKVVRGVRDVFGGGRGAGGIGGMMGGMGGPLPVYVVNRHLSMLPGKGWGFPGGGGDTAGGPGGAGNKLGSMIGKAALVAGVAVAAYEFGAVIENKFIKGKIGAKIFDWTHGGDAEQGRLIDRLNAQASEANRRGDFAAAKEILNRINLVVNIDKGGRVSTDSDDMNTSIDVPRGTFSMLN